MTYRKSTTTRLKSVLFCSVLMLSLGLADAQVQQTERYEILRKNSDTWYNIMSMNDQGLALIRDKEKYNGNRKLWEVIILDTNLKEKNNFDIEVNHRYSLLGYDVTKGTLYLLFRMGETTRGDLELIEIKVNEGRESRRFEIKPELDFKITHFNCVGPNIVLGGYVSNEPAILIFDPVDASLKVLPGFFQKDNELVDLRVNENNTFNVVQIDRSLRSQRKLTFRTFDFNGNLLLEDVIPVDDDKSLQNSITSALRREELMMLGTWGDKQGKQSLGFFSLTIDPFRDQKVNYTYFGLMDDFLSYMNPKRAARIRKSTRESLDNGRKPSFSHYVMPFRLEETPDGFLLLAEIYNPSATPSSWHTHPYGRPAYATPYYYYNPFWPGYFPGMRMYRPYPYGYSTRSSDNVKVYATVVAAFDSEGKPLWDRSIVLDDIKRPALEQISDFYYNGEKTYFLYKKESEIRAKIITTGEGEDVEHSEPLMLESSSDEVRSEKEVEDGVRYWFGNSFYVWGYHTIRNRENRDNRVRDVFYINKVVVD